MCSVSFSPPFELDKIDVNKLRQFQREEFSKYYETADKYSNYAVKNGILYALAPPSSKHQHKPRVLLPSKYHENVIRDRNERAGHAGLDRTLHRIQMDYVWTGMCTTIKKWLNQCVTCKLFSQQQPYTPPQSMPIPSYPFQFISIDLVGPLPQTFHGYQYILTLIDHLTGWADVFPITNKRGSTIADILVDRVFPQYGFPITLLLDNGTEFINTDVRNVCKAFGILHKHSTVFHPNSNGKIERFHRTFKQIIAKFAHENNTNWLKQLPAALNAYRTASYEATGQTPFQTLYGRPARLPRQTLQHVDVPDARISTQVSSWSAASENIEHSQRQNQQRARQTRLAPILKPGDHVAVKVEGYVGTFKPLWADFHH